MRTLPTSKHVGRPTNDGTHSKAEALCILLEKVFEFQLNVFTLKELHAHMGAITGCDKLYKLNRFEQ